MVERIEKGPSLKSKVRAHIGAGWHQIASAITEIPFIIRAIRAPEGKLIRNGEVKAKGRVVTYTEEVESGDKIDINVILTDNGEKVFSNPQRDKIELLSPK